MLKKFGLEDSKPTETPMSTEIKLTKDDEATPWIALNIEGNISIEKVASEDNIADIFTKPLKREVFNYLRLGLGMMELIMDSDSSSSQK
ncbi:hypothetical protein Tco_1458035 [Tanacetum coccineum]